MSDDNHFFLRDPWVYDTGANKSERADAGTGFETRSLHAGFDPGPRPGFHRPECRYE